MHAFNQCGVQRRAIYNNMIIIHIFKSLVDKEGFHISWINKEKVNILHDVKDCVGIS